MESLFGITGKGFTIIASDNNAARSIIKMKSDDDKQKILSNHLVMTYAGESGTCIAITGHGGL
jgi:probable proteasome subunit beta type-2